MEGSRPPPRRLRRFLDSRRSTQKRPEYKLNFRGQQTTPHATRTDFARTSLLRPAGSANGAHATGLLRTLDLTGVSRRGLAITALDRPSPDGAVGSRGKLGAVPGSLPALDRRLQVERHVNSSS